MKSAADRVFECLELRESIVQKQDTMQQLHTMLCSMRNIKQLPEDKTDVAKIKETVQFSKAYISTPTDVNVPGLNIIDLIRDEKWVRVLGKWKEYMINPDVAMSLSMHCLVVIIILILQSVLFNWCCLDCMRGQLPVKLP